jgi:NADPH-dependent curcumin reductase
MTGFLTTKLGPQYMDAFLRDVPRWTAEGKLKYIEDITEGLENAPGAFVGMLQGRNRGKAIVKVAEA